MTEKDRCFTTVESLIEEVRDLMYELDVARSRLEERNDVVIQLNETIAELMSENTHYRTSIERLVENL